MSSVNPKINEIVIDGEVYVPKSQTTEPSGEIKIVILQRGWIMVGRFTRIGSDCKLSQASVIRSWGTTKGLGEIAVGGPTSNTKLDKCGGLVEFDYLTVVAMIACEEKSWKNQL